MMTINFLNKPIFTLLLVLILLTSCKGQIKTLSTTENQSKTITTSVGQPKLISTQV
jgi:hypothetical protein